MSAIIKKNSKGYNYMFADLAATHQHLEESGMQYYQEIDVLDGVDYIVTVVTDENGKELRRSRGCRITLPTGGVSGGKSNLCQEAGSALTYARRYSLWMAFGLATSDDDAMTFTPAKPKAAKPERKPMDKPQCKVEALDRQAGMDTIKRLLDEGVLDLLEIQNEVISESNPLSIGGFRKNC